MIIISLVPQVSFKRHSRSRNVYSYHFNILQLQIVYYQDEQSASETCSSEDPMGRMSRQIFTRVDELEETLRQNITSHRSSGGPGSGQVDRKRRNKPPSMNTSSFGPTENKANNLVAFFREEVVFQKDMKRRMDEMMKNLKDLNGYTRAIRISDDEIESEPGSPLIRFQTSDDDSCLGSNHISIMKHLQPKRRHLHHITHNKINVADVATSTNREIKWARAPKHHPRNEFKGNTMLAQWPIRKEESNSFENKCTVFSVSGKSPENFPAGDKSSRRMGFKSFGDIESQNDDDNLTLKIYPVIPLSYSEYSFEREAASLVDFIPDIPAVSVSGTKNPEPLDSVVGMCDQSMVSNDSLSSGSEVDVSVINDQ